jgi:hypothetical protein
MGYAKRGRQYPDPHEKARTRVTLYAGTVSLLMRHAGQMGPLADTPRAWKSLLWRRHRLTQRSLLEAAARLKGNEAAEFQNLWPADKPDLAVVDRLAELASKVE